MHFETIDHNFNELTNKGELYELCCEISKDETKHRIKEYFMRNLGPFTQIEVSKGTQNDLNSIIVQLRSIENTIILQMKEKNPNAVGKTITKIIKIIDRIVNGVQYIGVHLMIRKTAS